MRSEFHFVVFFLIPLFSFSQKIETEVNFLEENMSDTSSIYHSFNKKLNWNDFTGTPRKAERISAETSSGIGYNYNYKKVGNKATIVFDVYCPFVKATSWVVNQEKKTAYILNHEQRHFDISYINALLFVRTIRNSTFREADYKTSIDNKYRNATEDMARMQHDYDAQSRNGIDLDQQETWNKKIDAQMLQLTKEILGR